MSKISMETCVAEMNKAAMNRKAALQIELAVGLAVFLTAKDPKATLCDVYANAGYQCLLPSGIDYKTVNRRINATGEFFKFLTVERIAKWAGKHSEGQIIAAIALGLEPYEIVGIADVQRLSLPTTVHVAPHQRSRVQPHGGILKGPTTGQDGVRDMFRRGSDKVIGEKISTEHLTLTVPENATRGELIEMAIRLMALAKEKQQGLLTN